MAGEPLSLQERPKLSRDLGAFAGGLRLGPFSRPFHNPALCQRAGLSVTSTGSRRPVEPQSFQTSLHSKFI